MSKQENEDKRPRCPECGNAVDDSMKYCQTCGECLICPL